MAVSTYPAPVHVGFLSICEGALLGLAAGWWLQTHLQPPVVFVGAGIAVACAYYFLLNAGRGSAMAAPVIIISMIIWGVVGWDLGSYLFRMAAISGSSMTMLDTVTAWKVVAALVFAFIAYTDKASMGAH